MGRTITYQDEGHKWHREQVAQSRLKHKGTPKPIKNTIPKFDDPYHATITPIKNQPTVTVKKEIIVEPGRIAQMIYARKCTNCISKECNGIDPCEEYKKLYEYETIVSARPRTFGT